MFSLREFLEAAPEMHDHQIALVSEGGKKRGLTVLAPRHLAEHLRGFMIAASIFALSIARNSRRRTRNI